MPLAKEEKKKIIAQFAQGKNDTGSPEVQVALLSAEISKLQEHLKTHKKDVPAKRGLLSRIAKRRRLLRYLKERNPERYQKLIKALNLRK